MPNHDHEFIASPSCWKTSEVISYSIDCLGNYFKRTITFQMAQSIINFFEAIYIHHKQIEWIVRCSPFDNFEQIFVRMPSVV